MHLLLQIKNIFKKILRCSARLTESTVGNIFILFLNICNDIAFNKTIAIKTVVLYGNSEKAVPDPGTLRNLPATIY